MNRILLGASLASILLGDPALAAYQDEVLADHPVAYYRFEEISGTTAFDTANSNDGTYVNGVLLNQPSAPALGRAASFDGINDYVSTPRTVSTDFTLEAWVKTTAPSLSGSQSYEGNGLLWSDVGGPANDFAMAMLNNGLSFFTGNPDVTVTSSTPINDGVWHHLVATRTQGGSVEIFIDGVSQGTTTTNNNPPGRQSFDHDRRERARRPVLRRVDRRGRLLPDRAQRCADPSPFSSGLVLECGGAGAWPVGLGRPDLVSGAVRRLSPAATTGLVEHHRLAAAQT